MAWIADIRAYEACKVAGAVLRLRVAPNEGCISATISDGTAELVVVWHLARPTPQLGLSPGSRVELEGVPRRDTEGLVMWEPAFHVTAPPHRAGAA